MKNYIEERATLIALYIIETGCTVRQAAKKFGVSKSTVHKDCTERLPEINRSLSESVRHVLGGLATREKYLHLHNRAERG